MIKPISRKSKWLTGLILVTIAALLINIGCAVNKLPVISSLALTTEGEIPPGTTAHIECTATDPDEDELRYTWSADGGTISGSGAIVSWAAPDEMGTYTINVEVSDGENIATDQLTITVSEPNELPGIELLITDCPRVKKAGTATITCEGSDPNGDDLIYTWSAERGNISNISEDGTIVSWVAPNEYGEYAITVTVSDGRGGEITNEITIIVCGCASACD